MGSQLIRLLIVNDHPIEIKGLKLMLQVFTDLEVVGEASNRVDAIPKCIELRPDVVLMDIKRSQTGGLMAIRLIRQKYPRINFIVLMNIFNENIVAAAREAGARACFSKDISAEALALAIREANMARLSNSEVVPVS